MSFEIDSYPLFLHTKYKLIFYFKNAFDGGFLIFEKLEQVHEGRKGKLTYVILLARPVYNGLVVFGVIEFGNVHIQFVPLFSKEPPSSCS